MKKLRYGDEESTGSMGLFLKETHKVCMSQQENADTHEGK